MSKNLKKSPNTLEDLKFVLATISEIRSKSLVTELRYKDILERYRTMAIYNIFVSQLCCPGASGDWVAGCISCFYVAIIKCPREGNLGRKEFIWFMLPEGKASGMAVKAPRCQGNYGSRRKLVAHASPMSTKQRETIGSGQGHRCSKPPPARSYLLMIPSPPQTAPPSDKVVICQ